MHYFGFFEDNAMDDEFYAHSKEGAPPEDWHRLKDHLKEVAEMAREFASDFGLKGLANRYLV